MAQAPKSLLESAVTEAALLLAPLRRVNSSFTAVGLLRDLGWELPTTSVFQNGLDSVLAAVNTLVTNLEQLGEAASSDDYADLVMTLGGSIKSVAEIVTGANGLRNQFEQELAAFPDFVTDSGIASEELPKRLLDYLIVTHLERRSPAVFGVLNLLGVVEIEHVTATQPWEPRVRGPTYPLRRVFWDRIPLLFTDPLALADSVYGWHEAKQFNADEFLERLERVLQGFLLPGGLYHLDTSTRSHLGLSGADDRELRVPFFQSGDWPRSHIEGGLSVAPLPETPAPQARPRGLALLPYLIGVADVTVPLGDRWEMRLGGSLDLSSGVALRLRPPHSLELDVGLFATPSSAASGRTDVTIRRRDGAQGLIVIFGSQDASVLGYVSLGARFLASLDDGDQEVASELVVEGLTVRIDTAGGDGFLQKILSGIKVDSVVDLVIGWSSKDGLYFRGSGALEITIPIHRQLGPIRFEAAYIALTVDGGVELVLAASLGAQIGPVAASVDRIGIRLPISFPSNGRGNVGPVDVAWPPRFKPPVGAGLVVDAGAVVGGGFLEFDDAEQRYAGILQLNFGEIGLVAIGLITTKMPDGSKGFSMLIVIAVEFSPAIQLSFGFTLNGVGGLIGIHRTMVVDVLRDGLKRHTLDSILFPQDPILNASKIISDLRSVFPPEEGRFVVGPMAKIGWGSPTIITADLGILIELPDPVRLVILGQLAASFPKPDDAIVVLHVDVLGVIEFAKKTLAIDATIYDSRILTYGLSGDGAVRLSWGSNPVFAMSLGGFHPRFSPPPAFPSLRRLKLAISNSSKLELSCKVYHALTSNSLQFGAKLELYAASGGASLDGELGFDTLIYFSPFSFEVDISGKVVARYKGRKLAGVKLKLTLSGPTPWRAKGKATFEILCWDVKVRFDKSWGRDDPAVLAAVDPWEPFRQALRRPESWGATLPPGATMVERLKKLEAPMGTVFVHPAGTLEVRQNVLPLDLKLGKFGNAPVKTHHTFRFQKLEAGQGAAFVTLDTVPLTDHFARGQYEDLSNSQRLSLPSFEKLRAGVAASATSVKLNGHVEPFELEYESIVIDSDQIATAAPNPGTIEWTIASRLVRGAAARRAAIRNGGLARFKTPGTAATTAVDEDGYVVVDAETLATIGEDRIAGNDGTMKRVSADQARAAYVAQHPEEDDDLLVVAAFEATS